jgi:NADH-quinone oxidoreductase subunit E
VAEALSQVTGAREGETSDDGLFTVERVACLGCCSLAPCIMINDETHGRLTPESVSKVVTEMRRAEASASVA